MNNISDMSAFNCRANVSGMCANFEPVPWYPSFYLKLLNKILIWHSTVLTTRLYCRCGIDWLVIINHLATDSSHISQLRFWIKFIFHPIDRIGGGEGSNSSHGSSIQTSFSFLVYTYEWANSGHNVWLDNNPWCRQINK